MKKIIPVAIIAVILFACQKAEPEKPIASKPASPAITAASGVSLAKVNDKQITEVEVRSEFNMLPFQVQQLFLAEGGMQSLLDELIKKEMLHQEAKKHNFQSDPDFRKKLNDYEQRLLIEFLLEKEIERKSAVTDEEAKKYYDENIQDFQMEAPDQDKPQTLDFETAKELIKQRLLSKKRQKAFDYYMEGLRKNYKVEIDEEAVRAAFGEAPSQEPPASGQSKE